jgi:hypothetical protein
MTADVSDLVGDGLALASFAVVPSGGAVSGGSEPRPHLSPRLLDDHPHAAKILDPLIRRFPIAMAV